MPKQPNPSPEQIVHIIDHLGAGGAQQLLANLVIRLQRRGNAVSVVNLRHETDLARSIRSAGIPVLSLGLARIDPRQVTRLTRLLRHLRPAIVHSHLMGANTIGRLASVLAAVPAMVVHDHESSAEIYTHPGVLLAIRRLVEPIAPPYTIRYLVVSQQAADYAATVAHWPPQQIRIVPNGIDISHIQSYRGSQSDARSALGLPPDGALIGYVGRLNHVKGVDVLLDALAMIPAAHLLVIGSGPFAERLTQRAQHDDIAGRVHMLGYLADIRPALRACDIYAQPSRREAFGLAAAEASAAGLPVVASAVGGLRDIVLDAETGILVPPDQPVALATALRHLLAQPEIAQRMGAAGQAYVMRELCIERVIERIEAIYAEVLG